MENSDSFGPLLQKRLFIAARVPAEVKEGVRSTIAKVKATLDGREIYPKWVRPENYHVTLCFLGQTEAEKIPMIENVMRKVGAAHKDFQLDIKGLGCFPDNRAARVLWAGVSNTKELRALQAQLADELQPRPVEEQQGALRSLPPSRERAPETAENDYVPHMTLARMKNPHSLEGIISQFGRLSFGSIAVSDIVLYESKFVNYNVVYTELFAARLSI